MLGMMNCPPDSGAETEVIFEFYSGSPTAKRSINEDFRETLEVPTPSVGDLPNALYYNGCSTMLSTELAIWRAYSCSNMLQRFNKINDRLDRKPSNLRQKDPLLLWDRLIQSKLAVSKLEYRSRSADTRSSSKPKSRNFESKKWIESVVKQPKKVESVVTPTIICEPAESFENPTNHDASEQELEKNENK